MKEWVKSHVLRKTVEDLAESAKDESEKEQWLAIKTKMLEDKAVLYHELISCLNCHFGTEWGEPDAFFYNVFGSVLADLPEEVFMRLSQMKNLFFVYTPNSGGETKIIDLDHDITEQKLQIVLFPYDSDLLPSTVLRGRIIHELVRVYTGLVDIVEQEGRIDAIAMEWGFKQETKAVKEHPTKKRSEKEAGSPAEKEPIASRTHKSSLVLMKDEDGSAETVYELRRVVTAIGRRPGNDIVLDHQTVSRRHAEICFEDDGYAIYDVASTNGTRVNGRYIHKEQLSDGDRVKIGPFIFTFRAEMLL
jgi:hypothetical protein